MSLSTTETLRSGASVQVAPVGTAINGSFAPLGYTTEKTTVKAVREEYKLRVGPYAGDVVCDQEIVGLEVSGSTIQVTAEQVCAALGVVQNGTTITLGGASPNAVRNFAVKLVGVSLRNGTNMVVYLPNAVSNAELSLDFSRKDFTTVPISFLGLDGPLGLGQIVFGQDNVTKTIASGTFARDAGVAYYKVAGEGGAADALTGITGSFVDGEEVVLVPANASTQPITLTHTASGTGVLNLDGAANWTMDNANDWIRFRYSSTGTKFVEVARGNAM